MLCSYVMGAEKSSVGITPALNQAKSVELRNGESYVDHISFMTNEKEVDMIFKMRFDEDNNTIRVSLLSYFTLMGFEQDVRYGSVIRRKKFRYSRMPYVMESDPAAIYKTTKELRSSMKPKKRKSIFSGWLTAKGASFDMGKYKVVNDYLERNYNFNEELSKLQISINDIFVLESPKDESKKKLKYQLSAVHDINTTYDIDLMRDMCRGEEGALEQTSAALSNIIASYDKLRGMQGADPHNNSRDSLKLFNEYKGVMQEQYKRDVAKSKCVDVAQNIEIYNMYIDSIAIVNGYYVEPELDPSQFYDAAREVDRYNTRWSISKDEVERYDLAKECNKLIESVEAKIATQDGMSERLSQAVKLFRRAKSNFYAITKSKSDTATKY